MSTKDYDLESIPITAIMDKRARMKQIRAEMALLRKEWLVLTGGEDIRGQLDKRTCLRCGYDWYQNDPFKTPARCPQCQSTSWMKPPTGNSRKPGDPPRPYWKNRRQSRKNPPVAKLRVRTTYQDLADAKVSTTPSLSKFERVLSTLDPLDPLLEPFIPPPPAPEPSFPRWTGSLSDALREQSEPQPEIVTSHVTPEPELTEDTPSAEITEVMPAEEAKEMYPDADVPPEQVGLPQSDAEREELQKAEESAWPTTKPE